MSFLLDTGIIIFHRRTYFKKEKIFFVISLDINKFPASEGGLEQFKRRHDLAYKKCTENVQVFTRAFH